jgi:uncharacterized damage-inducible protein DinB
MADRLDALNEYTIQANDAVVRAAASLSAEELHRDLGGSFPSVHATLGHILFVEELFIRRCQGLPTDGCAPPAARDGIPEITARWERLNADKRELVRALDRSRLDQAVEYRDTRGAPVRVPLWQALFQAVNHATFHRGQAVEKLRKLGKEPPQTDFLLHCRRLQAEG